MNPAEPARLPETPDLHGAFPRLSEQQLRALAVHGRRRRTRQGEVLDRAGDARCDFLVILEGRVAILERHLGAMRLIAVHGPGRFLGELGLLTGQAVFLTAATIEPGEVLVVPVDRLRQLVSHDSALGDLVLRAYLQRRSMLIEAGAGFRIIGVRSPHRGSRPRRARRRRQRSLRGAGDAHAGGGRHRRAGGDLLAVVIATGARYHRLAVFAAGDVRSGSIKRVASAVGEGSMVVRLGLEYLQVG